MKTRSHSACKSTETHFKENTKKKKKKKKITLVHLSAFTVQSWFGP